MELKEIAEEVLERCCTEDRDVQGGMTATDVGTESDIVGQVMWENGNTRLYLSR